MPDIRNPIVDVAPLHHMVSIVGGSNPGLFFILWDGDDEEWGATTDQSTAATAEEIQDLGAAIESLLGGTSGPIVEGDFTIDLVTHESRSSVQIDFAMSTVYVDAEPGYLDEAETALLASYPSDYVAKVGVYSTDSYALRCARAMQAIE